MQYAAIYYKNYVKYASISYHFNLLLANNGI
jgi:hypothetical protein